MKLSEILKGCDLVDPGMGLDTTITTVSCDSRESGPGCLFFAVEGHAADGHDYIGQALDKGAAAVVAQRIPKALDPALGSKIILARDTRRTTALGAANFYGRPGRDLTLVGITGTNGKTTTSWLLESIFKAAGLVTGVMGTVNIRYPGNTLDNPITTPDAITIQKHLARMKAAGVTHVIMEVSSHSLDQYRVLGCDFDAAIFTNLTQDHLDYHHNLDDYFRCKKRLFTDHLEPSKGVSVINIDDEYGRRLADEMDGNKLCTSLNTPLNRSAQITADGVKDEITGLSARLNLNGRHLSMTSSLTGRFNLENILGAAGAAVGLGIAPETVIQGIAALDRVPGRLEKLATDLARHIFVDYAHTPDALASILETLSRRAPARLITVFGCGGDRDRTKRGPMGKIACHYSDIAIVTSDNPRTESPDAIVGDIIQGIEEEGTARLDPRNPAPGEKGYMVEVDRAKALELAVAISRPRDIIVAAGKGHETYQVTNAGTIHFDDMEELARACRRRTTPYDWSAADLEAALGTSASLPAANSHPRFKTICTDSRTIEPGMVFLALAGENFDGHDFVPALVEKGIHAFVVRRGFLDALDKETRDQLIKANSLWFEVADTQAALGDLARFQRERSKVKLLAITGSNGKTTTRKMAQEIFAQRYDVLATKGNFNNEIGMPLTLLRLAPVHEWAVVEMGMSSLGEISRLTRIARPDIAVVTNTLGSHLEGLKTKENVARAKAEIFQGLREKGCALIFNDDPRRDILAAAARQNKNLASLQFFGQDPGAEIRAHDIELHGLGIDFSVDLGGQSCRFRVHSPARFMVNNALAAMAAALTAGLDTAAVQNGLDAFTPVKGRMNLGQLSCGTRLIDDTYNANPASMAQALKTLDQVAGSGRGLAALGDMLELGRDAKALHREIGFLVAELSPALVCLFGTQAAHIMAGALEKGYPREQLFLGTKTEIAQALVRAMTTDSWLLLKGSRGMGMETLIPEIETLIQADRKAD